MRSARFSFSVRPPRSVMTLGDTSEVYVKGKVDESDIGKVYLGQPARIKVESFKDKTFTGKVNQDFADGRGKR